MSELLLDVFARKMAVPGLMQTLFGRILGDAIDKVAGQLQESKKYATGTAGVLLDSWMRSHASTTSMAIPRRRAAASEQDIRDWELRAQFKLPEELVELYTFSDGVDWIAPSRVSLLPLQGQFPPLSKLCMAGGLTVPASKLARNCWDEFGEGEPRKVAVHSPGAAIYLMEEPETWLEFAELDAFLAFQTPPENSCLLMEVQTTGHFPVGTVLEFENLMAIRYESIKHWLAARSAGIEK